MKRLFAKITFALSLSVMMASAAFAGETGHYGNGSEGIKAATMPGPGFYYKMYNTLYTSDKMMDDEGKNIKAADLDLTVFANAHRFIWGPGVKVLGGDLLFDITIPVVYNDIAVTVPTGLPNPPAVRLDESMFKLGDICVEPLALSWHGERYDAGFGLAFFAPTGEYDAENPSSTGKDMWTLMLSTGATYYFDAEKTWTASILARYETHTEKKETEIRPGDDFHFEWGVAKTFFRILDLGASGYCQWQISDDKGNGVNYDAGIHDRVFAIGPEAGLFIPQVMCAVSLRSQWEFGAVDRTEGNVTTFSITKIF